MEKKSRLSKVFSYVRAGNFVKNQKEFAKSLDFSPTSLSSAMSGNPKYLTESLLKRIANTYPFINYNWLLTGEGEMLKDTAQQYTEGEVAEVCAAGGCGGGVVMVPMLNIDARGGLSDNDVVDTSECFLGQMPFSRGMAQPGDVVMPVYGDSMAPKYPSGSYVLVRPVGLWREYLEFGHTYVLGLSDGRRLLKTVQRGTESDTFALLSFNGGYPAQDIPKSIVTAVFRVVAMVRQDGM